MAGKEVNYGKKSSSRNVGRRGFFRCSIFVKEARVRCDRCNHADLADEDEFTQEKMVAAVDSVLLMMHEEWQTVWKFRITS